MDFNGRIKKVLLEIRKRKLDGILLSSPSNLRYVSGFTGEESVGLVSDAGLFLITDFRYLEQARKDCPSFQMIERKKGLFETSRRLLEKLKMKMVAVEEDRISHKDYIVLSRGCSAELVDSKKLVEKLRMIKDKGEIEAVRAALAVSQRAFRDATGRLRKGMTEKAIANEIEFLMKKAGAECAAFDTIAAVGSHSSLPHARPTEKRLRENQLLLIDWGARCDFYNSDLTRTLFTCRIPSDFRKIYSIVLDAQKFAIEAVRPGVKLSSVDRVARDHISKKGYGENFGHGLGHGVGLEVHEGPFVNSRNDAKARPGMIFTIEPAIYIPGRGGVRVEDMVLVTEKGHEVLSRLPNKPAALKV